MKCCREDCEEEHTHRIQLAVKDSEEYKATYLCCDEHAKDIVAIATELDTGAEVKRANE